MKNRTTPEKPLGLSQVRIYRPSLSPPSEVLTPTSLSLTLNNVVPCYEEHNRRFLLLLSFPLLVFRFCVSLCWWCHSNSQAWWFSWGICLRDWIGFYFFWDSNFRMNISEDLKKKFGEINMPTIFFSKKIYIPHTSENFDNFFQKKKYIKPFNNWLQ